MSWLTTQRKWAAVAAAVLVMLVASAWYFTGFGMRSGVQCSSTDATSTTVDVLKTALAKDTFEKASGADNAQTVNKSNIRAAIAQMVFLLEDVRTTRQDPNSTKRFCEGTLKVRFPAGYLSNADEALATAGLGSVTQLADTNNIDRDGSTFSSKIDYDVQPTDTGDKLFAETDTKTPIMTVASQVLATSLLHGVIQQAAANQKMEQQAQQAQQTAALAEQKAASLDSAKADNQLAQQSILAVWRSIPPAIRAQMLPQQRAWVRKKDADCRVEAASTSTDPTEMEVARLSCDTRTTQDRKNVLENYRQVPGDEPQQEQPTN